MGLSDARRLVRRTRARADSAFRAVFASSPYPPAPMFGYSHSQKACMQVSAGRHPPPTQAGTRSDKSARTA
jgi:hypothetical protein